MSDCVVAFLFEAGKKKKKKSVFACIFFFFFLLHIQSSSHANTKLIILYKRVLLFNVVSWQVPHCSSVAGMGASPSSCALNSSIHRRSVSFTANPTGKPSKHIN